MRGHALLAIGVLVVATTACGIDLAPTPEPGSRQWIIRVDNQSRQEARLVIAEAGTIMGETVGRAEPAPCRR